MHMSKRFDDKAVLITGAGGGIGRATALAFALEGARLALLDLSTDGIAETLRLIEQAGGRGNAITTDISNEQSVARAVADTISALGNIDYAVNNAGISHSYAATADISSEEWNRVLGVNVTGAWLCMREELRHMAARGTGVIVNLASFAGLRTLKMQSAYVASKHAVVGLTKNAAVEYAGQGIRINAVAPGGVLTPMLESTLAGLSDEQKAGALAQMASLHPLNRVGAADEIADAILFICSEQAAFMTGTVLSVDGGWSAS